MRAEVSAEVVKAFLQALRGRLAGQGQHFDDAVVRTCIDIIQRECVAPDQTMPSVFSMDGARRDTQVGYKV